MTAAEVQSKRLSTKSRETEICVLAVLLTRCFPVERPVALMIVTVIEMDGDREQRTESREQRAESREMMVGDWYQYSKSPQSVLRTLAAHEG